jgi:DNA helicase HerA-like ATPase
MHFLVNGESGTGKTTWAKNRVLEASAKGKDSLILDPFLDDWGQDAPITQGKGKILVTADREQFIKWFWEYETCLCIVDESAVSAPRNDAAMTETAILGRHMGHLCVFLCQRVQQVHPTIRGQCSHLVVFGCSARDAKLLAEEYDNEGLLTASSLPPGTFYYLHRRGKISKEKVF